MPIGSFDAIVIGAGRAGPLYPPHRRDQAGAPALGCVRGAPELNRAPITPCRLPPEKSGLGVHPLFTLFPSAHGHLLDRRFVIADYDDGRKTIVLDGPAAHERGIHDMDRLDAATGGGP